HEWHKKKAQREQQIDQAGTNPDRLAAKMKAQPNSNEARNQRGQYGNPREMAKYNSKDCTLARRQSDGFLSARQRECRCSWQKRSLLPLHQPCAFAAELICHGFFLF